MQSTFGASKPSRLVYKCDDDDDGFMVLMLTKDNYSMWLVDIRALLRRKGLWKYTQQAYKQQPSVVAEKDKKKAEMTEEQRARAVQEQKAQATQEKQNWAENAMRAADEMTPRIAWEVKQMLEEFHYDDGYLMLKKLEELLQPITDAQFMRLTKEFYSLKAADFSSMSEFLAHVKVLNGKIIATKVRLTEDKQLILGMMMALPEAYSELGQSWSVMPNLTAEQARNQLLEEERRQQNHQNYMGSKAITHRKCPHCNHTEEECWALHPEKAPEWYRNKN